MKVLTRFFNFRLNCKHVKNSKSLAKLVDNKFRFPHLRIGYYGVFKESVKK